MIEFYTINDYFEMSQNKEGKQISKNNCKEKIFTCVCEKNFTLDTDARI